MTRRREGKWPGMWKAVRHIVSQRKLTQHQQHSLNLMGATKVTVTVAHAWRWRDLATPSLPTEEHLEGTSLLPVIAEAAKTSHTRVIGCGDVDLLDSRLKMCF